MKKKVDIKKILICVFTVLAVICVIGLFSATSKGGSSHTSDDIPPSNDTNTDVVPSVPEQSVLTFTDYTGEGLSYSPNVDSYDYLWASVAKDGENDVFEIGKNAYAASSQLVYFDLDNSSDCNVYTVETNFKWSGNKNGVSGVNGPTWFYRFSLSNASGASNVDFLNLWFCSQENTDVFALVSSTSATVNDYLTVLNINQWYKLTIKYYVDEDYAAIFIDDKSVGFVNSVSPDYDSVCGAFEIENRGKVRDSIIYLDNLSYTMTKREVADSKETINFTIESTTYTAEADMTWAQWCASKYNQNEFIFYESEVITYRSLDFLDYLEYVYYSTGPKVNLDEKIIANGNYILGL